MPPRQHTIQCDSLRTLECELDSIRDKLAIPESEETWDTIAKAVSRFTSLIQNGASNFPTEVAGGLRSLARPLNSAILSERSRLSGAAIDLLKAAAEWIGKAFDAIIPLYIPTLLTLCSRSNKVFISRAKACIINIIEATQAPTILSYLAEAVKDKSLSLRLSAAETGLACMNSFNPPDLEKEARAREVEVLIKFTATDASADVRKVGRQIFEAYRILLPHRVDNFTAPLTPTAKKYLEIRSRAPSVSQSNPPSRPTSSQSTNSASALSRPKSVMSTSTTTLFQKASDSKNPVAQLRVRTIPTAAGQGLTRSESAPSTSRSTFTTTTNAAPVRPALGPSRPKPVPNAPPKGPSRPVSSQDMPPPPIIPIRPSAIVTSVSSSSTEPNPFAPTEPIVVPTRTAGRPARPAVSQGPSRVPQDTGDHDGASQKQRVVGGARRVLLPEPIPQPTATADAKQAIRPTHSRTASNTSVGNPAQTQSTEVVAENPPPAVAKVEAKKVHPSKPKPASMKSSTTVPSTKRPASSKRGHDPSASTTTTNTTTTRRAATTSNRLTEPTQSQLAKAKASKPVVTKKTEVAKPIWGRQASGKANPPPKAAVPTTRKRTVSAAPRATPTSAPSPSEPETAAAVAVPLPPSPSPSPSPSPLPQPIEVPPVSIPSPTPSPPSEPQPQPADEKEDSTEDDEDEPTIIQQVTEEAETEIRETTPFSPPSAFIRIDPATPPPSTPRAAFHANQTVPETPISSLLESIQRGFEFSPAPPFDPDQTCTYGGMILVEDVRCEPLTVGERKPLAPIT